LHFPLRASLAESSPPAFICCGKPTTCDPDQSSTTGNHGFKSPSNRRSYSSRANTTRFKNDLKWGTKNPIHPWPVIRIRGLCACGLRATLFPVRRHRSRSHAPPAFFHFFFFCFPKILSGHGWRVSTADEHQLPDPQRDRAKKPARSGLIRVFQLLDGGQHPPNWAKLAVASQQISATVTSYGLTIPELLHFCETSFAAASGRSPRWTSAPRAG